MRRMLFLGSLPIPPDEALEIARRECERQGWSWNEPIHVSERLTSYQVMTNADATGGNAFVTIDGTTGEVRSSNLASY